MDPGVKTTIRLESGGAEREIREAEEIRESCRLLVRKDKSCRAATATFEFDAERLYVVGGEYLGGNQFALGEHSRLEEDEGWIFKLGVRQPGSTGFHVVWIFYRDNNGKLIQPAEQIIIRVRSRAALTLSGWAGEIQANLPAAKQLFREKVIEPGRLPLFIAAVAALAICTSGAFVLSLHYDYAFPQAAEVYRKVAVYVGLRPINNNPKPYTADGLGVFSEDMKNWRFSGPPCFGNRQWEYRGAHDALALCPSAQAQLEPDKYDESPYDYQVKFNIRIPLMSGERSVSWFFRDRYREQRNHRFRLRLSKDDVSLECESLNYTGSSIVRSPKGIYDKAIAGDIIEVTICVQRSKYLVTMVYQGYGNEFPYRMSDTLPLIFDDPKQLLQHRIFGLEAGGEEKLVVEKFHFQSLDGNCEPAS